MRINLTARTVDGIKRPRNGKDREIYWDTTLRGFGLRITQTGARTWIAAYRKGGRKGRLEWLTIGAAEKLSLADARERARTALAQAQIGGNPAADRRKALDADTFGSLARLYIEKWARRRKRPSSAYRDELNIRGNLLPAWHTRKVSEITRDDVVWLLEGILARGAKVHANRVLALIKKIFNWAIEENLLAYSPAHKIRKPTKENPRERVLRDSELGAVWRACETEAPAFKLLLLTGQRRSEVLGMSWSEIEMVHDDWWWNIPSERTKNGVPHRIPLVGFALEILKSLRHDDHKPNGFVFNGKVLGTHFKNVHKPLQRIIKRAGVESFRVHDFRRTLDTRLARLKVPREIREKVFNHLDGPKMDRVYNVHDYDDEKRDALMRWDCYFRSILMGNGSPDSCTNTPERRADFATMPRSLRLTDSNAILPQGEDTTS